MTREECIRYAIKENWGTNYDRLTDIRELAFYAIHSEEIEGLCLKYIRDDNRRMARKREHVWKDICKLRPNDAGYQHFYHWLILARKEFE